MRNISDNYLEVILHASPHYNKIITYHYDSDDEFSFHLISWFSDIVSNIDITSNEHLTIIKNLDASMWLYINNYNFRKRIIRAISLGDISISDIDKIKNLILKIIAITSDFKENYILNITSSKWV